MSEQKSKKAQHQDLTRRIVEHVVASAPGVGDTISKPQIGKTLGEDPTAREFLLAFHDARDELVEQSPSYCFKVKQNGEEGEYVRMPETERSEKAGMRYLRKARKAAYRGVRRVVRTDTSDFTTDQKREHERRVIQTSNAYFEVKDAIKRADPEKGGRWLHDRDADPEPRPHFASPKPGPKKPHGKRWLTNDAAEPDEPGSA